MRDFEQVIHNVTIFHSIFDIMRIVDPVRKEVVYMKRNETFTFPTSTSFDKEPCYSFWASGSVCENCISMRALQEHNVFVKFEYVYSKLFMTTSYPLEAPYDGYVVEILKDVTDSELIINIDELALSDVQNRINNRNQQLITDPLTGVFNRRYLTERLPYELVHNNMKGFESGLLLMDIDHFKSISETYGHSAKECMLQDIVRIIRNCIRIDYDWIARSNEQEFLIYLKHIQYDDMEMVAEKIRRHISSHVFKCRNEEIQLTTSIGAAHVLPQIIIDYKSLIHFTNVLLRSAKRQGRNQVVSKSATESSY